MVSLKRTGGAINGFIKGHQRGNRKYVGPLPLSMVSLKGAGSSINGFIEGCQGGGEPAICHREEVASIYLFPNQIGKEIP